MAVQSFMLILRNRARLGPICLVCTFRLGCMTGQNDHWCAMLKAVWNLVLRGSQISVSAECKDLVRGMLQNNPANRMTLQQIIDHPWFQTNLPEGALTMNDYYSKCQPLPEEVCLYWSWLPLLQGEHFRHGPGMNSLPSASIFSI